MMFGHRVILCACISAARIATGSIGAQYIKPKHDQIVEDKFHNLNRKKKISGNLVRRGRLFSGGSSGRVEF